ncbi:MAG: prepilin-type N-terminal cleavage/methylation domain-containing protein [Candidatus Brocadiia bacterium]
MKKAFTLIELLVVIAIIAILAAMLMPSLSRARAQARESNCRGNLRNQGLSLAMLRNDKGGVYPGLVDYTGQDAAQDGEYLGEADAMDPETWVEPVEPFYAIYTYSDSVDIFDDPGWKQNETSDFCWGAPRVVDGSPVAGCRYGEIDPAIDWGGYGGDGYGTIVTGSEYLFDYGRIAKNSASGRVIMACAPRLDHIWGANYGRIPHAHSGGSNVLHHDGAVSWAPKEHPEAIWANKGLGGIDYFLEGYTPNPRMDEDAYLARATAESEEFRTELETDIDSIYACDVQAPGAPDDNTLQPFDGFDNEKAGTQWDRDWSRAGVNDGEYAPSPGWACEPSDPWAQTNNANDNTWRPYRYTAPGWYWYEERGIFATEARWNKYDSRCAPFAPWTNFGVAGSRQEPLPSF